MENINFQLDVVLDTNAIPLTQGLLGNRVKVKDPIGLTMAPRVIVPGGLNWKGARQKKRRGTMGSPLSAVVLGGAMREQKKWGRVWARRRPSKLGGHAAVDVHSPTNLKRFSPRILLNMPPFPVGFFLNN